MDGTATVQPSRFARLTQGLRATLRLGLDTALPRLCPACRDLVTDQGVCPACWSKLAFIAAPYCPRLGIPFAYDPGPGILSMQAIADPPAYQRARAAVRYDDVAAKLVHAFKYGDRLDLAPLLGRWMVRAGKELFDGADALVPVPLHWRRLWARRFNQSAALAQAISRADRDPGDAYGAAPREGDRCSRSGSRAPSAPPMCRARSASILPARPRSRGAA